VRVRLAASTRGRWALVAMMVPARAVPAVILRAPIQLDVADGVAEQGHQLPQRADPEHVETFDQLVLPGWRTGATTRVNPNCAAASTVDVT
jgi:hypothetical protein